MQVAFWSPNHGQTGTTSTALTMAIMLALINNFKVLLAHSQFEKSTLESCFIKPQISEQEDILDFSDSGLDALRRLAKNGRLLPEMLYNYTIPLLGNRRLDLLQGTLETRTAESIEETALLRKIFYSANEDYDLVFIDVCSGTNYELTKKIIEDSDVVVVCLNQNIELLDQFFSNQSEQTLLKDKSIIYNLGFYNEKSKYTLRNLKRLYKMSDVMSMPYNIEFLDACNNHQVLDYFMRYIHSNQKDKHNYFMETLKKSAEVLLKQLENLDQEAYKKDA